MERWKFYYSQKSDYKSNNVQLLQSEKIGDIDDKIGGADEKIGDAYENVREADECN